MTTVTNIQPSIWSDLKTTVRAVFSTVVTTARTTEKVVLIAENEVDNINEMQLTRLDLTKSERTQQLATLTSQQLPSSSPQH